MFEVCQGTYYGNFCAYDKSTNIINISSLPNLKNDIPSNLCVCVFLI
jgi:hypothetical protein